MNGVSRSHSNIASKRKQHINLQTLAVNGQRVKACSNCIRTQTKHIAAVR